MTRLALAVVLIVGALGAQGCVAYTVASTAVGVTAKVAGTAVGVGADVVGGASDAVFTSDDEREAKAAKRARDEEKRRAKAARR